MIPSEWCGDPTVLLAGSLETKNVVGKNDSDLDVWLCVELPRQKARFRHESTSRWDNSAPYVGATSLLVHMRAHFSTFKSRAEILNTMQNYSHPPLAGGADRGSCGTRPNEAFAARHMHIHTRKVCTDSQLACITIRYPPQLPYRCFLWGSTETRFVRPTESHWWAWTLAGIQSLLAAGSAELDQNSLSAFVRPRI